MGQAQSCADGVEGAEGQFGEASADHLRDSFDCCNFQRRDWESISDRSSIAGAETSAWTAPKRGVRGQGTWPKSYTDVGGSTATHPDAQPRAPPRITANVSEHLSKMIHEERAQRRTPVFHDVKPATREYEMVQHQQNLLARSKIPEKRTADNFFRVRERLKEVHMKSKIDGLLQGAIKWQEKRREKAMDSSDFSANSWHIKRGGVNHADCKMESDIGLDVLRPETACLSKTGHIKMVHRLHVDEHDEMMMRFMEEDALRAASLNDPADVGMEHEGDKSKLDMDEVAAALFRNERKAYQEYKNGKRVDEAVKVHLSPGSRSNAGTPHGAHKKNETKCPLQRSPAQSRNQTRPKSTKTFGEIQNAHDMGLAHLSPRGLMPESF